MFYQKISPVSRVLIAMSIFVIHVTKKLKGQTPWQAVGNKLNVFKLPDKLKDVRKIEKTIVETNSFSKKNCNNAEISNATLY